MAFDFGTAVDTFGSFLSDPLGQERKNVEAPEPSEEEQALYAQLLAMLGSQTELNEQMLPLQMAEAGYTYDPITYTEEQKAARTEYSDLRTQSEDIIARIKEIQSKMDGASVKDIQKYVKQIEKLNAQLGPLGAQIEAMNTEWGDILANEEGAGEWRKMTDEEYYASLSESEREAYDLAKAQRERSMQAIAGELPLSEELLAQKEEEFQNLKQVYGIEGDNLETASGTDTVAVQNLSDFKKRWAQIEDAQRFGQAGSDVQSAILSSGLTTDLTSNQIGQLAGISGGSGTTSTFSMAQSLLSPYQQYNAAGYQAAAQNAATQNQSLWGGIGLIGALASSKDYKTSIKKKTKKEEDEALKKLTSVNSYSYNYKKKMGLGNKTHIGTLTEESPKEMVAPGGKMISLGDKMELQSMAIKSLNRKLDKVLKKAS